MYIYIYVCMYVNMDMHIHIYTYANTYVYIYIYMYIYICIYIYRGYYFFGVPVRRLPLRRRSLQAGWRVLEAVLLRLHRALGGGRRSGRASRRVAKRGLVVLSGPASALSAKVKECGSRGRRLS